MKMSAAWVGLGLIVGLGILATAAEPVAKGRKMYEGCYFNIYVPPGFVAKPQGEIGYEGKTDEVWLWNQKMGVQFYVYSPIWNGQALFKKVDPRTEVLTAKESKKIGDIAEEQLTITAQDKSYVRFVVERINVVTNNNTTFGIRVPDMKTYELFKPTYLDWKKTLVQFAD